MCLLVLIFIASGERHRAISSTNASEHTQASGNDEDDDNDLEEVVATLIGEFANHRPIKEETEEN